MGKREQGKPRGNRRIDRIRDGAGKVAIAPELGTIITLKAIGDRLYTLAERGVVSCIMADSVDPKRTNESIPQVLQRTEISYGTETPFIRRTLCTAFQLFDTTYLPNTVDVSQAHNITLEAAVALAAVSDVIISLVTHQEEIKTKFKDGQINHGHLPRTANLKSKINGCITHFREVEIALSAMVQLFFSKEKHNEPWHKSFYIAAKEKYTDNSEAITYIEWALKFLRATASHRHAMVHPKATSNVQIFDYEMAADGSIFTPSIEINESEFPVPRFDVSRYLQIQLENISHVFETFICYLCDMSTKSFNPMFENRVSVLPDNELRFGSRFVWSTTVRPEYADNFREIQEAEKGQS